MEREKVKTEMRIGVIKGDIESLKSQLYKREEQLSSLLEYLGMVVNCIETTRKNKKLRENT